MNQFVLASLCTLAIVLACCEKKHESVLLPEQRENLEGSSAYRFSKPAEGELVTTLIVKDAPKYLLIGLECYPAGPGQLPYFYLDLSETEYEYAEVQYSVSEHDATHSSFNIGYSLIDSDGEMIATGRKSRRKYAKDLVFTKMAKTESSDRGLTKYYAADLYNESLDQGYKLVTSASDSRVGLESAIEITASMPLWKWHEQIRVPDVIVGR